MPDHLWVPPSVRAFIRDLAAEELRRTINLTIMSLADDPLPPDARLFRADGDEIENAYELDVDLVTIFYTVNDEHVFVQTINWRVLLAVTWPSARDRAGGRASSSRREDH
jgi:hypothetical protein